LLKKLKGSQPKLKSYNLNKYKIQISTNK